jgi:hypothetical protein
MNTYTDIESIPGQKLYESFLEDATDNFKAPSALSKAGAAKDLGMDDKDAKFTSKDDVLALWVDAFKESKVEEVAEEAWRKTALDGTHGELISMCYWVDKEPEPITIFRRLDESEKELLNSFFLSLDADLKGRPPYFIGHNITFDLKFIWRRAVILGVKPPFKLPIHGRHRTDYFCTMKEWCDYGKYFSQDNLCKALNIAGKPDDIDGSKVWDFVKAGEVIRVSEYNEDDVRKVREIHKRLTFTA